jgi:hypothetical protein
MLTMQVDLLSVMYNLRKQQTNNLKWHWSRCFDLALDYTSLGHPDAGNASDFALSHV